MKNQKAVNRMLLLVNRCMPTVDFVKFSRISNTTITKMRLGLDVSDRVVDNFLEKARLAVEEHNPYSDEQFIALFETYTQNEIAAMSGLCPQTVCIARQGGTLSSKTHQKLKKAIAFMKEQPQAQIPKNRVVSKYDALVSKIKDLISQFDKESNT